MTYHSKRRWRSADRCRRISTWAEAPVHLVGGHRAATTGPSSLGSPAAAENSASAPAKPSRAGAGIRRSTFSMATRR